MIHNQFDYIAIVGALLFFVAIVEVTRRGYLSSGFSLLWLLVGSAFLILAAFRPLLHWMADLTGIFYPPSLLFIAMAGGQSVLLMVLSVLLHQERQRRSRLVQEMGLLGERVRRLEDR